VLDQIELFLGSLEHTPSSPGLVLTTVLEADLPASESQLLDSVLSRFRGRPLDAPPGRMRAGFDGPARAVRCATALADNVPALRAGIHTGECEVRDGMLSGSALAVATYLAATAQPGEVLATSTVQDLVAGSGIEFDERGSLGDLRLFSVQR
jgi:class 3 adenylate cyclase